MHIPVSSAVWLVSLCAPMNLLFRYRPTGTALPVVIAALAVMTGERSFLIALYTTVCIGTFLCLMRVYFIVKWEGWQLDSHLAIP